MWLHYSGPVEIDIDRWKQVKISSGLISLASHPGFLRQAERRHHHTRLLFREGIWATGLGMGQALQKGCFRLQSRLAGGITGARAQLRDHHEAIKGTRTPPTHTPSRSFHKDTSFHKRGRSQQIRPLQMRSEDEQLFWYVLMTALFSIPACLAQ